MERTDGAGRRVISAAASHVTKSQMADPIEPCEDVSSRQTAVVAYSLVLWILAYLAARKPALQ